MIRVLIADDQALVRGGLRSILSADGGIDVVAEAANGAEAIDLTRRHAPDVVLMDLRMPVVDGIEATRVITGSSAARVIVVTTFDTDEYIYSALRAGATGFILKDDPAESLADAIRTAHSGMALLTPVVTRRIIDEFVRRSPADDKAAAFQSLTSRELDVLKAVARGMSNAEVASALFLGEATVKTHVTSILAKLSVRDRVQAVVFAYEHGLVKPREA
ncbi:MAG TPA: response regulator transcription factor [Microbacteriaceae bacterium]